MLECNICLSEFDEATSLPCGHVFCLLCIRAMHAQVELNEDFKCPQCRSKFPDLDLNDPTISSIFLRRVYLDQASPRTGSDDQMAQLTEINRNLRQSIMDLAERRIVRAPPLAATTTATPRLVHPNIGCDGCHQDPIVGVRYKCLNCSNYDLCGQCKEGDDDEITHPTHSFGAIAGTEVEVSQNPNNHHEAFCDVCKENITQTRYKCMNCPDADSCANCLQASMFTHPGHRFVAIHSPCEYFVAPGERPLPAQHQAHCNHCMSQICGPRYKCVHPSCPDFDLCESCEALSYTFHPIEHPMVKMKVVL